MNVSCDVTLHWLYILILTWRTLNGEFFFPPNLISNSRLISLATLPLLPIRSFPCLTLFLLLFVMVVVAVCDVALCVVIVMVEMRRGGLEGAG